jgi:hypothetical protein
VAVFDSKEASDEDEQAQAQEAKEATSDEHQTVPRLDSNYRMRLGRTKALENKL